MQPDATPAPVDPAEVLRELEAQIADLMPVAADMIATTMENLAPDLEAYEALLTVAEEQPPQLLMAILRTAAGLAHISDFTPAQMRALNDPPSDTQPTAADAAPDGPNAVTDAANDGDLDKLLADLNLPTTEELADKPAE